MDLKSELLIRPADYPTAKKHSEKIDQMLGVRSLEIEKALEKKSDKQNWIGLDVQSFQTPYSEIVEMIEHLNPKPDDFWIDLGAAYGRMGIVLGTLKPEVRFLGFEYVPERAAEANRIFKDLQLTQAYVKAADLISESIDPADVYFIYDFGTQDDIYQVLEKLRQIARHKEITIVARGRGIKNWIYQDFPWLYVRSPEHFENWSVFRS